MQTAKKKIKLLFLIIIFISNFIGIATNVEAVSSNNYKVKVAWYNNLNTEKTDGLENEYYEKLSEVTGLDFEYVPCSFNESLTMLQNGEVDVVAGVAYNSQRAKLYTYIMSPMSFITVSFLEKDNAKELYYEETQNLNYKKPEDFIGKKIGILEVYKSYYLKVLKSKNIDYSKLNLISYSNCGVMKKDLLAGDLDYIISFTDFCDTVGLKESFRLKKINLYFCVNRTKKDIIEKLNTGIRNIKKSNPNYNEQLYYNYFSKEQNNFYYTPREKVALSNVNELIFYVQKHKTLDYNIKEDGTVTGYYGDYIKELAGILGKKYRIFPVTQKVLNESILPGFYLPVGAKNGEESRALFKKHPKYDPKYLTNITRETEKIVCVNYGVTKITQNDIYASTSKCFCENIIEDGGKAIHVENDFEGLKLLSEHKVNAVVVDIMLTDYVNDLVKYKNIAILNFTRPINECMIGINGMNDDLFSAVNKTIRLIPEKDSKMFMVNESSNHSYKPNLVEYFENQPLILFGLGTIVLIAILIFIKTLFVKNNKIRELAKDAIEAKKNKNSFLSKISHEMRTPLNAIISFADFGVEEKRDPIYASYFQKIKFSADTLISLMQDVLLLEKKSSLKTANELAIVKNMVVRDKIESIIRPLAEAKNIEFEILFEKEVKYFKINIKEAQQILLNILTNAIKYTKPGGKVIWQAKTKRLDGNKLAVTHIISDNGVGISNEFQKHMFEPFTMENNELSKTEIGTGLGLAICMQNIEKLGGKITCKSKLGEGTNFKIEFEILLASNQEIKEYERQFNGLNNLDSLEVACEKKTLNKKLKILLCEDVAINAQIVIKILTSNDMDVEWIGNGKEGVEKALKNHYDVILMDIRMPIMDGLRATELIREKDKTVIIIALSANVYESDKLKSLAAGMNDHLGKPINKKELLKVIYHLVYEQNKGLEKGNVE